MFFTKNVWRFSPLKFRLDCLTIILDNQNTLLSYHHKNHFLKLLIIFGIGDEIS